MDTRRFRTAVLAAALAFKGHRIVPPQLRRLGRALGDRVMAALDARRARADGPEVG